jgi:hypothetical protein
VLSRKQENEDNYSHISFLNDWWMVYDRPIIRDCFCFLSELFIFVLSLFDVRIRFGVNNNFKSFIKRLFPRVSWDFTKITSLCLNHIILQYLWVGTIRNGNYVSVEILYSVPHYLIIIYDFCFLDRLELAP